MPHSGRAGFAGSAVCPADLERSVARYACERPAQSRGRRGGHARAPRRSRRGRPLGGTPARARRERAHRPHPRARRPARPPEAGRLPREHRARSRLPALGTERLPVRARALLHPRRTGRRGDRPSRRRAAHREPARGSGPGDDADRPGARAAPAARARRAGRVIAPAALSLLVAATIFAVALASSSVGELILVGRPARWVMLAVLCGVSVAAALLLARRRLPLLAYALPFGFLVVAYDSAGWSVDPSLTAPRGAGVAGPPLP